ncbi:PLP-dependent aminotransferase family protein [Caenimonas sp. SL110]|uniref:aminotransferase-like domain-containing protein n=1 Tax=Caenimonas sp. SL110 TaxID=1450524 RepID=UPI000653DADE|nr:PLP-dependent aminotransferase family protein [Caenimonas sp. SL110]
MTPSTGIAPVAFSRSFADPEGSPIRELFRHLAQPAMISFAGGYPSPALLDAEGLEQACAQCWGDAAASLQYGPTEGNADLRESLAGLSRGRGVACDARDVLVTTGSQQAFDILVRIFIEPGDAVVVEAPAYPAALQALRLAGASILQVPVDEHGMQVDMLREMLAVRGTQGRPKLLYTVPNYSNPSGTLLSAERRTALVALAIEHGFLIIEDDPYGQLYFDEPPGDSLHAVGRTCAGASNPVIYLSSLSKTVAPSLRIGWMVAPDRVLRRSVVAKQTMDLCTSPLAQRIAATYLALDRYEAAVLRSRATYGARMQAMTLHIDNHLHGQLTYLRPLGGMFIWARTVAPVDPDRLFHACVKAGVLFVPGKAFFAAQPDRHAMRLSYAAPDIHDIGEGVNRLAGVFRQLQEQPT